MKRVSCVLSVHHPPDTGDEADGSADPIAATTEAYDAIMSADGYHPISLVSITVDVSRL